MRFTPPPAILTGELTWLLAAAFGSDLPPLTGDPSAIPALARQFDLAPRIVARHGTAGIEKCLGAAAGEMIQAHRRAAALELAGDNTARRIAALAAGQGFQVVFLKGFALRRMVPGPAGWRPSVDLDVLLSRHHADRLRDLLVADGWAASKEPDNPQHLPPVHDPEGTPVDIHYRLRGVKVAGERWATAEELLAADLCQPAELSHGAWLPRPAVLAAHLAVHTLEQHGHRPATYPLLRGVGDIIDLTAGSRVDVARVRTLTGESLAEDEVTALFALARILTEGRTPSAEDEAEQGAEALLRHIIAGTLDPKYRRGLALGHTAGRLRQARQDGELMRYIAHKLGSSSDRPEATARGSVGGFSQVRRRILRPIHLAARFTSAAAARLRRTFNR